MATIFQKIQWNFPSHTISLSETTNMFGNQSIIIDGINSGLVFPFDELDENGQTDEIVEVVTKYIDLALTML